MINDAPSHTIRLVRLLPAPPEEVFDAWTDPASMKYWMCPGTISETTAQLDVRVGGRFTIVMRGTSGDHVHSGEYREIERPRRLAFTWVSKGTHGRETIVTIELRSRGRDQTELTLTHEGMPDDEATSRHRGGWGDILTKLEAHVTRAGARPEVR